MARSIGGGLASAGLQNLGDAEQLLGKAAEQEQTRLLGNQERERARKSGNTTLGATGGAMLGFQVGGPVGGLIGGVLGAIGGGLF